MNANRPVVRSDRRMPRTARLVAPAALLCGGGVAADTIKQRDGTSLTTVMYAGASAGQDVRPRFDQNGAYIDGSLRARGGYAWALNADPFERGAAGARLGAVELATGTYMTTDIHWSGPAPGASRIPIGISFNQRQEVSGSRRDSDGHQGKNMFQLAQPEIVVVDADSNPATREATDYLYVVYGADRHIAFKRTGASVDTFRAYNGAAGIVLYVSGSPDTYVWTDQHRNQTTFFGGNTSGNHGNWQFWKIEDPAGNVAYVGDKTTASTAVTNGYSNRRMLLAFNGATGDGARHTFTYTSVDGTQRLTEVKVETKASGTWSSPSGVVEIARVTYDYYTAAEVVANSTRDGPAGYLQGVTVRTSLSDSGSTLGSGVYMETNRLLRYYVESYSNADCRRGGPGMLMMVVGPEGTRSYGAGFASEDSADLKEYADAFFEYPSGSDYKISSVFFNGECGCGGGVNGAHTLTYASGSNYTTAVGNTSYDTGANDWNRAVVGLPNGTFLTQYADETGQPTSRVITDGNPGSGYTDMWATQVIRDSTTGCVTEIRSPAANDNSYTHSTGAFTGKGSDGLITLFARVSGTDVDGFVEFVQHKKGTGGTVYYDSKVSYDDPDYTVSGGVNVTRPMIAGRREYHVADVDVSGKDTAANYHATTYTNTFWSGTSIVPKQITTTYPVVTTGANGSNSALSSKVFLRKDGTTAFTESRGGRFDYLQFTNGLLTKRIEDAITNGSFAGGDDPNTDWTITETGNGWDRTTDYTYDAQGRLDTTTLPDDRVMKQYYSKLSDGKAVVISIPRVVAGSPTYHGPAGYIVLNHAGKADMNGLIAITSAGVTDALSTWIEESESDPITALDVGTLARMTTRIHTKTGTRVQETRGYFVLPGSGAGADGTNYDVTMKYGYDSSGRVWRTVAPDGTIYNMTFDDLGRVVKRYIGTNDSEVASTDDMVEFERREYDGNADGGNSLLTKVTLDPDGLWVNDGSGGNPDDRRITQHMHDLRGRIIVTLNPTAPHSVAAVNNLGQTTAVGLYSSTSGLDATDSPSSATNRVALSETFLDEWNREWKRVRHSIDASDGSDDADISAYTWYDAEGRVVKRDGEELVKYEYDRLGRMARTYVLGYTDDTDYSAAGTLTSDVVLEEHQTVYESSDSDNVVMRIRILRFHDDLKNETTGVLDEGFTTPLTSTYADLNGYRQMEVRWYDALDRVTTVANLGTYGTGNYTWTSGGVFTSSSATELVTETVYNDDGTVSIARDAEDRETRFTYDALGRMTKQIANYVNGSPSGANGADDVITLYTYTDGHRTKLIADIDGNGEDSGDQVTTYIYGTTAGTIGSGSPPASTIATGHLLREVLYPEQVGSQAASDRTVYHAYNALADLAWMKDPIGNVHVYEFDASGRRTHDRVTTFVSPTIDTIKRITTAYDSLGRVTTVTTYDNASTSSGTAKSQTSREYDGYGNITEYEQDPDSAIGSSGRAAYSVTYTYAEAETSGAGGRNTIRRTGVTYPGLSDSLAYEYVSTGNLLDNNASRVTRITVSGDASVPLVDYDYLGTWMVVGTDLLEPEVRWELFEGGSGGDEYPHFDRFMRVEACQWERYSKVGADRYIWNEAIVYSYAGDITSREDNVQTAGAAGSGNGLYDVQYTLDGLHRLTKAEEGNWTGSAINNRMREEDWTLDQLASFDEYKRDWDGDNNFNETDEFYDNRGFNDVNELRSRDTDNNGATDTNDYEPDYDKNGNLIDDDKRTPTGTYTYRYGDYDYDAWNRPVAVKNQAGTVITQYGYNGEGHMVWSIDDTDSDGDADGSDAIFYKVNTPDWKQVAEFRSTDTDAKFVNCFHNAGADGLGGSSYIDSPFRRLIDLSNGRGGAADGVYEKSVDLCQRFRPDISVVVESSTGKVVNWIEYLSYGREIGLPIGDINGSGAANAGDTGQIQTWAVGGTYDVRADTEGDNDIDASDLSAWAGYTMGLGVAHRSDVSANPWAWCGYVRDYTLADSFYHVRHRLYNTMTPWMQRDPVESMNLYAYGPHDPLVVTDPYGLTPCIFMDGPSPPSSPLPICCHDQTVGVGVRSDCHQCCFDTVAQFPALPPWWLAACRKECNRPPVWPTPYPPDPIDPNSPNDPSSSPPGGPAPCTVLSSTPMSSPKQKCNGEVVLVNQGTFHTSFCVKCSRGCKAVPGADKKPHCVPITP